MRDEFLHVVIDSHATFDALKFPALTRAIRDTLTYNNPDFWRMERLGYSTYRTPRKISTFAEKNGIAKISRGAMGKLRVVAAAHGVVIKTEDRRVTRPVTLKSDIVLYPYQMPAAEIAVAKHQGIIRGPCACGKTIVLLKTIEMMGQQTLVIMHNNTLVSQWREHINKHFGFRAGFIGAGKREIAPITVALQQTLARDLRPYLREFGAVVVDETHRVAARTFVAVVDRFPARYRIGASADERRKDKKEFLIYDTIGPGLHEITNDELIDAGRAMPVDVRVVRTEYENAQYVEADSAEKDYTGLITDMLANESRNRLILATLVRELAEGKHRGLVLVGRVQAAEYWVAELNARGIPTGLMIGGVENKRETERVRQELIEGNLSCAVGTTVADEGLDIPALDRLFVISPSAGNTKRLEQQVGRLKRPFPGKSSAVAYYLWDEKVFPKHYGMIKSKFGSERIELI